eukprot:3149153-Pyramimonas_sp.AAC.1
MSGRGDFISPEELARLKAEEIRLIREQIRVSEEARRSKESEASIESESKIGSSIQSFDMDSQHESGEVEEDIGDGEEGVTYEPLTLPNKFMGAE